MGKEFDDKTDIIDSKTLAVKIEQAKKNAAHLRQMNGAFIGRKYPLDSGTNFLGRDPDLTVPVQDASISRRHAELVLDGENLYVHDLKSTNGSYISDNRIESGIIQNGELVRFGSVIFKYTKAGDVEGVFEDELHVRAHIDALTGSYNRKYLMEYMDSEISRCQKLDLPLAMIMVDLDHFKKVNDTYGHPAGDFVLKKTVEIIKDKALRSSDILGRYGGEEFCIVLSEARKSTALVIAERIRSSVEKADFTFEGTKISITLSLGVSHISDEITSAKKIIESADEKLYKAKEGGRNKVES